MTLSEDLRIRLVRHIVELEADNNISRTEAVAKASKIFGVNTSTTWRLLRSFTAGNSLKPDRHRGAKHEYVLPDEHLEWLVWWIQLGNNKQLYLDELVIDIHGRFGITYTEHQVSEAITSSRAKLMKRDVEKVAAEQNHPLREDFRKRISKFSAEQLLFADESHCDQQDAFRSKGRSFRGEPAFVRTPGILLHGKAVSSVVSMSIEGIMTVSPRESIINGEICLDILKYEIMPIMNPYPGVRSVLVLDNAGPHMKACIHAVVNATKPGALVLYLPPYSYDFNPLELGFHLGKARLRRIHYRRHGNHDVPEPLCNEFGRAMLDCMTPSQACNFFRHCHIEVSEAQEEWANR